MSLAAPATPTEWQTLLEQYQLTPDTLAHWEAHLGLSIPTDATSGEKRYSRQHISLFKNVKKFLAIGRTLDEIKTMIQLPDESHSSPVAATPYNAPLAADEVMNQTEVMSSIAQNPTTEASPTKPYSSIPQRLTAPQATTPAPTTTAEQPPVGGNAMALTLLGGAGLQAVSGQHALRLVEKVMDEKDQLHKQLVEAEKLNSHLYNVNHQFHRKVKELTALVGKLKTDTQETVNIKLMNDKAKLHRQLLEAERQRLDQQRELDGCYKQINHMQKELLTAQQALSQANQPVESHQLLGDWHEASELQTVVYDSFGVNIEASRTKTVTLEPASTHAYGQSIVVRQTYTYQQNALWQRHETLLLSVINAQLLQGELTVDYWLDGSPVCQARYSVTLTR
jgi:DNA-binding transcriptional MerR regulator